MSFDFGIVNKTTPIAGRSGEAEFSSSFASQRVVHIRKRMQLDLHRQIKDLCGSRKPEDMSFAHEAGANQADPEFLLVRHA